jgi:hypothetical protein
VKDCGIVIRMIWQARERRKVFADLKAATAKRMRRFSDQVEAALKPTTDEAVQLRLLAEAFQISPEKGLEVFWAVSERVRNLAGFLVNATESDSRAFAASLTAEVTEKDSRILMGQTRGLLPFWRSKFFLLIAESLGLFIVLVQFLRFLFSRHVTPRINLPLEFRPSIQPNAPALI